MCVILISFMTFGSILISTAFETMINREKERSIEEIKIYQYALVASLEGLPKDYQATDFAVSQIAKSLKKNLDSKQDAVILYNKKNKVIYQNSSYRSELIKKMGKEKTRRAFEIEHLDPTTRYNEFIITTMRTAWGTPLEQLKKTFGKERWEYCLNMAAPYLQSGKLEERNGALCLTREGIFVSDSIMSDLLWVD